MDGKVQHPTNTMAWKRLDTLPPDTLETFGFGSWVQNVCMSFFDDGIFLCTLNKSPKSTWPVLAFLLNLPVWLFTKKFFTLLVLLILDLLQVPFEFFDVWMPPLIDDLKML